jgi:hypothetical protein
MLALHQQYHSVLGPLVMLGAVECEDVSRVLAACLHGDLQQLICLDESAHGHIRRDLRQ